MTNNTHLERRYRRLLAFFPKAFRREREHEVVSVLMEGSQPGQRWPRLAEASDLIRHSISMRWRQPNDWARKHTGLEIVIRVGVGVWLVCLTAILAQQSLWGLALLVPAVLHFALALRVAVADGRGRGAGGPRSPRPPGLGC